MSKNKYSEIEKFIGTISLAIGVASSKYFNDWAVTIHMPSSLSLLLSLGIVAVLHDLISKAITELFQRVQWFRKVLIGDSYIEGVWFEIVQGINTTDAGILHIHVSDYKVQISGENFTADGQLFSNFRSESSTLDWPILRYKTTRQSLHGKEGVLEGYGELQFVERKGAPLRLTGFFVFTNDGNRFAIDAVKITAPDVLRKLDEPRSRSLYIKEKVELLKSGQATLQEQKLLD